MAITQTISALPQAGKRGVDVRDTFVTKQEAFQDALQGTTVAQLNTFANQVNSTKAEVNTLRNDTEGFKNTAVTQAGLATQQVGFAAAQVVLAQGQVTLATTKANEASSSAASALASKNAIESMVIPTEATYNYAHIDSASNIRDLENFLDFNF